MTIETALCKVQTICAVVLHTPLYCNSASYPPRDSPCPAASACLIWAHRAVHCWPPPPAPPPPPPSRPRPDPAVQRVRRVLTLSRLPTFKASQGWELSDDGELTGPAMRQRRTGRTARRHRAGPASGRADHATGACWPDPALPQSRQLRRQSRQLRR